VTVDARAALLIAAGPQQGGFAAAVGAFLLCGALIVLSGLVWPLGRLIAAIPPPIAGATLAGVLLLPLCLAPVKAVAEVPLLAVPLVLVWALVGRLARPWAVPAALVAAVVGIVVTGPGLGRRPRPHARLDDTTVRPGDAGGCRAAAVPGDDGLAERPGDGRARRARLQPADRADPRGDGARRACGRTVRRGPTRRRGRRRR
jgi:hypothetical protein